MSTDPPRPRLVEPPDPFDPAALRLDQAFTETSQVKKLLRRVPVRRPHPHDFCRVHPDKAYRMAAALIEFRDERDAVYVVSPTRRQGNAGRIRDVDALHDRHPAGRGAVVAGATAAAGRTLQRVAPIGGGGGRARNDALGPGEGQPGVGRLRNVRGSRHHPGPGMAARDAGRTAADRL